MIRNIVFDMGQVLTRFDPDELARAFVTQDADVPPLRRAVFDSPDWQELDRGTVTEEELIPAVCRRLPVRLHEAAARLLLHWRGQMEPLENIVPLIHALKAAGYGIYLLSNAGKSMLHFMDRLPVLSCFDGTLFSAEVLLLKPEPGIYRAFFRRFSLLPEECFFVDDRAENIAAGQAFGMKGFCYGGNPEELEQALICAGVSFRKANTGEGDFV